MEVYEMETQRDAAVRHRGGKPRKSARPISRKSFLYSAELSKTAQICAVSGETAENHRTNVRSKMAAIPDP
jgi:hypothetical protein